MTCRSVTIGPGVTAIVCGRVRSKPCSTCGRRSSKECDWKLKGKKAGATCSAPMCGPCVTKVGPDKDLCPVHARAWDAHPANPKNKRAMENHDADGGEQAAQESLNRMHEEITGRRPGLLDMLDADSTSFEDVFGETLGDR